MSPRPFILWWAVLAAFVSPACDSRREPPANLLVVTLDTTRADRLGCYGRERAATPRLDRLAAEGVLVENAVAVTPLTLPSHASLFTGLYPPEHGVRVNADFRVPDQATLLAEHLAGQGYATGAAVGAYVLSAEFGIAQGFEFWNEPLEREAFTPGGDTLRYRPMLQRPANEVTDAALEWLGQIGDRPFFLWVHYFDPHVEYAPPEPYASRFSESPYEGEIAYVDAELGRLLDALEARGRGDRTLVVATADHGESLGEHGEQTHGLFVYGATLRVPLLLRLPGILPAGSRIDRLVSGVDVAPTVLELLDLPVLPGASGESFAEAARGRPMPPRRPAYAESEFALRSYGWAGLYALEDGRQKFIDAPRPELYELAGDAGETANLASSRPGEAREWERRLEALRETWPETQAGVTLDAASRERLASLGYISSAATAGEPRSGADPKERVELHDELLAAQARLKAGDRAGARATLERVLGQDPDNPAALAMKGSLLCTETRCDEGLELLTRAVSQAPGSYELQRNLAGAAHLEGRLEDAARAHRAALALRPESLEATWGLGNVLYSSGDYPGAVEAYEDALALGPDSPGLLVALGKAHAALGRTGEARSSFRAAVAADPTLVAAWHELGILAEKAGDLPEALRLYERGLEADPGDPDTLFDHAKICLRLGDLARAASGVERLLASRPDYPLGRYLEGQVKLALGDEAGAKAALEAFLRQDNADPRLVPSAREQLLRLGS